MSANAYLILLIAYTSLWLLNNLLVLNNILSLFTDKYSFIYFLRIWDVWFKLNILLPCNVDLYLFSLGYKLRKRGYQYSQPHWYARIAIVISIVPIPSSQSAESIDSCMTIELAQAAGTRPVIKSPHFDLLNPRVSLFGLFRIAHHLAVQDAVKKKKIIINIKKNHNQ